MRIRETIRQKWVVPVGALVLVMAIGASAWAASGASGEAPTAAAGSSITQTAMESATSTTTMTGQSDAISDLASLFGLGEATAGAASGAARVTTDSQAAAQTRELMQQRRQALLRLVRNSIWRIGLQ
ncbi:MAG: hypothetical protein M1274_10115 [Actinobacteria bacterium]|nr:hypothetical protein [Actinomycetota bacterium]